MKPSVKTLIKEAKDVRQLQTAWALGSTYEWASEKTKRQWAKAYARRKANLENKR